MNRKQKIFIIGHNKTGTTSLEAEFIKRGYLVGKQGRASRLLKNYGKGDFEPIIDYCKTAQVFQDIPFSYPETYKHLDKAYPNSKFILSVRDSPEQWYNSITKFHSKLFGNGNIPTKKDLQNAKNIYPGFMWDANRLMYNTPEDDPYNKDLMVKAYTKYNDDIRTYFKDNPNFLEINLAHENAYRDFCEFLNLSLDGRNSFPWENKTSEIKK